MSCTEAMCFKMLIGMVQCKIEMRSIPDYLSLCVSNRSQHTAAMCSKMLIAMVKCKLEMRFIPDYLSLCVSNCSQNVLTLLLMNVFGSNLVTVNMTQPWLWMSWVFL